MGRGGIIVGRYCHPSSVVEQCFRKAQVVGSSPMGGFHYATGGALRAAPVAAFQPPSASPLATRAPSADWIGRRSWSLRLVPPRRWPRRQSRRVPWVAFSSRQAFTQASSLRDIGLGGRLVCRASLASTCAALSWRRQFGPALQRSSTPRPARPVVGRWRRCTPPDRAKPPGRRRRRSWPRSQC